MRLTQWTNLRQLLVLTPLLTFIVALPLQATEISPPQVRAGFEQQTLQGYSRAFSTATLASEVTGRVQSVRYDVGDTLSSEALLQIDPTFINLELQEIAVALQQNNIQQQQAVLRTAWLQREFERRQTLVGQGRVSRVAFEEIEQQRDQSQLEQQQLVQQQRQLHVKQQTAQERQHRHQPHAPQGWIVSERLVEPGEQVKVGDPLFNVQDFSRLLVPLALSHQQLTALQQQQQATLNGQNIHYQVYSVSPAFDERTRKIQVELEVLDYSDQYREGLLFKVPLTLPQLGLMVPQSAVSNRYGRPQVQRADNQELITIQILDRQGDWIKIAPNNKLEDGTRLVPARSEVQ
ncbi:MAG: hypothetical protein BA874_13660 [Desulfuromonadales bacterium C00003068]|jgi:RND family efflux transporter MFP subunit|nr:MAG: hypothetical protein BA874_13660 [Desulfuromonadales bacterium C00003068]